MKNVEVKLIKGSYSFEIDYGMEENSCLIVSSKNLVSLFLNGYDYNDEEKRHSDMLTEILIPMFGEAVATNIVKQKILEVKNAFSIAEQYITDYDLFVEPVGSLAQSINKLELEKNNYAYRSVHNKENNSVSYYIKSKIKNNGEFGIVIHNDNSFDPIFSTKTMESNIPEALKEERRKFLKYFVKEVLGKNINFGTTLTGKIKIKGLNLVAIKDSKIKEDIENYMDEDNIIEYDGPVV